MVRSSFITENFLVAHFSIHNPFALMEYILVETAALLFDIPVALLKRELKRKDNGK